MTRADFADHVEGIVGPIRAAGWRKDRMREELSAHLSASWDEECARGGGDRAAAERAIRRLGEAVEVGRDLQDSVPRLERWLCTPLPVLSRLDALDLALSPRVDETPLRHAARVTAWFTASILLLELFVVPAAIAIHARPRTDWPTTLLWAAAALVVSAVGGFLFTMLHEATIDALGAAGRGRSCVAAYLASSSLIAIALGLAFSFIISFGPNPGAGFAHSDWPRLVAGSLFAPPLSYYAARTAVAQRRQIALLYRN